MTSHYLSLTHRELEGAYGAHTVGALEELHPMAKKMIEECAPHEVGVNSRYQEFLTFLSDDILRITGASHDAEKIKRIITPEKFSEFMTAFALGLQYSARKVGGNIKPVNYRFSHTLVSDGAAFKSFDAAVNIRDDNNIELLINPTILAHSIMYFSELAITKDENRLTTKDMITLLAVEEMMHVYQAQHGIRPSYSMEAFDKRAYDKDHMEQEANVLKDVAIRELRLGSKYQGLRR